MPKSRFLELDVFAATRGGGNPLGVVVDAQDWSDPEMQAFAAWTELVETTFLAHDEDPSIDYRVRIFTPTHEIPYAGHPSVGSAYAALYTGFAQARANGLMQRCGAGDIPLRLDGEGDARSVFVRAPSARVISTDASLDLAYILKGSKLGVHAPALVEGGRRWWLAELADEDTVRRFKADFNAIATLAKESGTLGLCIYARSTSPDHDIVVRAFPAGVGIVEDPASGAANGLLAAYLAQVEPESPLAQGYRVSQGREMGRDARLVVRRDDDGIWVGGTTHVIVDGVVDWR